MATDRQKHLTELAAALALAVSHKEVDRIAREMSSVDHDGIRGAALRLKNAMEDIRLVERVVRLVAERSEP